MPSEYSLAVKEGDTELYEVETTKQLVQILLNVLMLLHKLLIMQRVTFVSSPHHQRGETPISPCQKKL